MIRRQSFVFTLKPNNREASALRRFAGSCRFVWNELLRMNDLRRERGESRLGYAASCRYLAWLKTEQPWLADVHSQALQQTLKDLSRAYANFFNRKLPARFPAFKKKGRHIGIRFPQGFKLTNNAVYLPKIGWIGFRASRKILGTPKSVTVYEKADRWFMSVLSERAADVPMHSSQSAVGIDMGVKVFATLSTGELCCGPNVLAELGPKLAHLQRQLARRVKFSKNWRKTQTKISRFHARVANVRADANNKLSTKITKNHAIVVIEDLRIGRMTAHAGGTIENPGKNVARKCGLNRRILDQGWRQFAQMLDYKLTWHGGLLVRVDPKNTSRLCRECGYVAAENRATRDVFHCVSCGKTENADVNAAANIRERGLALIQGGTTPGAPVERSTSAVKQETRSGSGRVSRRIPG